MLKRLLAVALLLVLSASSASATTYYVNLDTGSNANTGLDTAHAWQTLPYGLATAACGDLVYVMDIAGVYPTLNTQTTPIRSCLSFGAPLTVKANPGDTVHLTTLGIYAEKYVIFDGFVIDGACCGNQLSTIGIGGGFTPVNTGAGYLRFLNNDIAGPTFAVTSEPTATVALPIGGSGHNEFIGNRVHTSAASDTTDNTRVHGYYIENDYNLVSGPNCEIDHIDANAVQIYGSGGTTPDYNTIQGCYIHHNGLGSKSVSGIVLNTGTGNVAQNNVIVWNTNGGGTGAGTATANKFIHNTIAFNGVTGSGKNGAGCSPQCYPPLGSAGVGDSLINNIVWGNWSDALGLYGSGLIAGGNLCSGTSCAFYTDPLFTNGSTSYSLAGDFNISITSPARDTGITSTLLTDYLSTIRPQNVLWDPGAFEYIVGSGPIGVVCVPSSDFALIAHTAAGSNDAYTVTTAAKDTTSACLVTLAVADESDNTVTVSDTYTNTWNARTAYANVGAGTQRLRFYDCYPCLVGPNHTFTVTFVSGISYPAIAMVATSGSPDTPPFDQINGNVSASATSRTTGAIVPIQAGEFVVAACSYDSNSSAAFDVAFTLLDTTAAGGATYGVAMGYLRQTDAASVTGTCTTSVASPMVATIASYKFAYTPPPPDPPANAPRRIRVIH